MTSVKLIFLAAIAITLSASVSGGLLDYVYPTIMAEFYSLAPTKEGYRYSFEEPNGSKREEMGVIMNPGTPEEQLVVMGTYSSYDEKTGIESTTMYTADKDGYKPRYTLKNRKLSPGALKSAAG